MTLVKTGREPLACHIQHMPAAAAICRKKVQVIAGDTDPLHPRRAPEADQRAAHVMELKHGLRLRCFCQRRIRQVLRRHATRAHMPECAIDANGARAVGGHDGGIELRSQLREVGNGERRRAHGRLEIGYGRERRAARRINRQHTPIVAHLVAAAVQGDHLPAERVERADAKVAVCHHVCKAHLAVINAGQKRVDGRNLIDHPARRTGAAGQQHKKNERAKMPYLQNSHSIRSPYPSTAQNSCVSAALTLAMSCSLPARRAMEVTPASFRPQATIPW